MRRIIFAFALLFALGSLAVGQWGSRGCVTPGFQLGAPMFSQPIFAQPVFAQPPAEEWKYATNGDLTTIYLYKHGLQVGGYCYQDGGYWRDYDAKTDAWGDKVYCQKIDVPKHMGKKASPVVPVVEPDGVQNFGVEWGRIENHQFTHDGKRISCDKAKQLIQAEIPDHSKKFHLVTIGTEVQCKTVTDQMDALEPELKARILSRCVRPGDFSLKDTATNQVVYKQDGAPSVYFQAADGKVLHRQDDAVGAAEAVRKAVKKYDQAKDPDLRKPDPVLPSLPALTSNPAVIPGLAMAGLLLFALMRGKR